MRVWALTAMLVAILCGRLWAGPLDAGQLPADVRFFVHFDLDAARQSQVFKSVRSQWLSEGQAKAWLDHFGDATGSDALSDFHGITVFGTTLDPDRVVGIIRGNMDPARVAVLLGGQPDHRIVARGRYQLHLWTDTRRDRTSAAAFFDAHTLLFGMDPDALRAELDLLDGKSKTLAEEKSELSEAPPAGTFFQLAARGLGAAHELHIQSPVAKELDGLFVWAGEKDGRSFVHGRLVINKSAEVTGQVRALLDGMRAFAVLRSQDMPAVRKLLSAIRVDDDGQSVLLDLHAAAGDVVDGIRELFEAMGPPATQPSDRHGTKR